MRPPSNSHLPLPTDLHRRRRLHEEIATWAAEHAGTDLDLDDDLEQAGIEAVETEASR